MNYFARNGAPCPPDANPAEHIIDVVQGNTIEKLDWTKVWNQSEERKNMLEELEALNEAGRADPNYVEDTASFATSYWFQFLMVTKRLTIQIWRSPVRSPFHPAKRLYMELTNLAGLHVEQDHPSYLRRDVLGFHVLEDGRWYFRPPAAPVFHFVRTLDHLLIMKPVSTRC